MKSISAILLTLLPIAAFANPCSEIDQSLSNSEKVSLAPIIAKQLKIDNAEVLQSYSYQGWRIFFINTHVSDETYLFFSGNPLQNNFITQWSGAATANEEKQINQWVRTNAKEIPNTLASCFAWHVTKGNHQ